MSGRDKLHKELTSSSKQGTDLIDLTSSTPKDVNFERSLSRTDTRKRRLLDSSNHQDRITDLSDQDQHSLETTGRKRGRLNRNGIAKPTFGMEESKDEQLHYEKRPSRSATSDNIGNGADDELALNPSESQREETSSNAHLRSIAAARHIPINLMSSFSRIRGIFTGQTSSPPLSRTGSMRDPNREVPDMTSLVEELRAKDKTLEKYSRYYNKLNHKYEELEEEVKHMAKEEQELERQNQFLLQQRGETVLQCQTVLAEARRLEAALSSVQEKYEALIRKQQEESFKQMSTARWLPIEDSKIVGQLDRFKREMRSWAKASAVKDLKSVENLDRFEVSDLLRELSRVAVLKNGRLPDGLPNPKVAALLLNALLAHHLYTSIFKSPFFCLEYGYEDNVSEGVGAAFFEKVFQVAQKSSQEDAHAWRSQTLRLLLPALGANSKEGERTLRAMTEENIAKVSEWYALDFVEGAARYLLDPKGNNEAMIKSLQSIYLEAANLSYNLWTQRTTLDCITLQDVAELTFDADGESFKPHSLVRYDEHEDQLKGKPITLMVHPLLRAFGTDDGKDYNCERIWASAEVWLDSR